MIDELIGTCLQPYIFKPSLIISDSTIVRAFSWAAKSVRGKKIMPTPKGKSLGVWPVLSICWVKKFFGMDNCIPAPSPVLPSASTAPRWYKTLKAWTPNSTISLVSDPSKDAINPTPHDECSSCSL